MIELNLTKECGFEDMDKIGCYDAKTHFSEIINRVLKGESITITKHGIPVAVLSPFETSEKDRMRKAIYNILKTREESNEQIRECKLEKIGGY